MSGAIWTQRAQPLLGTMALIRLTGLDAADVDAAFNKAFAVIRHIGSVMSAHNPDSDLGRLARAGAGDELMLDPHTVAVLRLAKYWYSESRGAFNPVLAAHRLGSMGQRPAFTGLSVPKDAGWQSLEICGADRIRIAGPLWLDLGGIAKGYAVDQAIAALRACGVHKALVNAGGDLRALGSVAWPVQVSHARHRTRTKALHGLHKLRDAALATSASKGEGTALVRHVGLRSHSLGGIWTDCTVMAPDCVSADALTKWGLQARPRAMRLQRVLRRLGARVWRNP